MGTQYLTVEAIVFDNNFNALTFCHIFKHVIVLTCFK